MAVQKVEIELWDKAKNRIADITNLVRNRAVTLKLNGVDSIQFSMDLQQFDQYCKSIGVLPRTLLWPLTCDIIVKLGGVYWKGFECVAVQPYLNTNDATISVRGSGFLSMFDKRFITKVYGTTESTTIAADMITTTQAQMNGSYGVTIGAQQYPTGIARQRSYENKSIKDALLELGALETGRFDINFTYDKKFETYADIGALRRDTPLRYGPGGNIKNVDVPTEGSTVSNLVTGLGSGFGADQLRSTAGAGSDVVSQLAYGVREELPQFNSIINQSELDENTATYVAKTKDMLQIPHVVITSLVVDLLTTSVGDRFPVDLSAHTYTDNIDGLYRVQQMDINWDDQDFADITLTFDDQGVNQGEA